MSIMSSTTSLQWVTSLLDRLFAEQNLKLNAEVRTLTTVQPQGLHWERIRDPFELTSPTYVG